MRTINLVALLNFVHFSDPNLSAFAIRVIKALTNNASFPGVQPFLGDLGNASAQYDGLLAVSKGGSRFQQEEKNVAREVLIAVLRKVCKAVNNDADGNRAKLLSSGFDIYGVKQKSGTSASAGKELKAA